MTRVTFVSYDDAPPAGGQGVVLRGMRDALEARGHQTRTISGRGDHAVRFTRVSGRAPLDFSLHVNRHPAQIRRLGGDVVQVNGGPGGVILLRDPGAPVVYTANHTYRQAHPPRSLQRLLSPLEARAYRRASMVLAISASTARAVSRLGVAPRRIEVLTPGVEPPLADGPARDAGRVLFAGRWETEKGVLDAVEIMARVLECRPGATAVVVGSGHLDDEVRRVALGSGVEVIGRVDEQRLREEYARAAVVLIPSRYEGLGLVALEAQAAGAVVVGTDVDGLRDAVFSPDTLVDVGDIDAAVDQCLRLIDNPGERGAIAAGAQREVLAVHSWDVFAARLEQVYAALHR
ncbi:MAG: glycosyltransferase family 4 protein [Candidatus Dormibacteraeota bacterium]|nr:glycosyltransferase family 4 protein [Candidatus Dormibacteraeota bacterium]